LYEQSPQACREKNRIRYLISFLDPDGMGQAGFRGSIGFFASIAVLLAARKIPLAHPLKRFRLFGLHQGPPNYIFIENY
jgi:hypothetical protein